MKKIQFIMIVAIGLTTILYAVYIDTGFIQWQQPDGTTFIARQWGDEFEHWMETDDGYQIAKGSDDYYYYADLDSRGEFTVSGNKVGINIPLASSYKLERSMERKAEIETEIELFNLQLEKNAEWFHNKMASGDSLIKLGVVLVDFTPSKR